MASPLTLIFRPSISKRLVTSHQTFKMRLNLAIIAAICFTSVTACKCVANGNKFNDATMACCGDIGGEPAGGDDCRAFSIDDRLSDFRKCCKSKGYTSDCDCPTC